MGVANFLSRRNPKPGTPEFGKAYEHYILMELLAWQSYRQPDRSLTFWRTASGFEVDFIIDDFWSAIEVKASARVHDGDLRALRALRSERKTGQACVVCMERESRKTPDGIAILPWRHFLERLWAGDALSGGPSR